MNKVFLIGRLTRDVELKTVGQNNSSFCRFTLAVDRMRKDDGADFISCVAWKKTAELLANYNGKGDLLAVFGRLQTGSYTDREGKKVYTEDVVAEEIQFLTKKSDKGKNAETDNSEGFVQVDSIDDFVEQLPF